MARLALNLFCILYLVWGTLVSGKLRKLPPPPLSAKSVHPICPPNVCGGPGRKVAGASKSQTITQTRSRSITKTPSLTPSLTPTQSRSATSTPTQSPSGTSTPTQSRSATSTPSQKPSAGPAVLAADKYCGSSSARDPCSRGLASLFAFGNAAGDSVSTKTNDGATALSWTGTPFKYFGTSYNSLYPTTNGVGIMVCPP